MKWKWKPKQKLNEIISAYSKFNGTHELKEHIISKLTELVVQNNHSNDLAEYTV